jgi:protein tyrosine phosphatase (PTP) superfamily phosphohydrolase (DUF442 family)
MSDNENLPNFHQVSPTLYRGAEPTAQGLLELAAMGVKTVVNLEMFSAERDCANAAGLCYVSLPFDPFNPQDATVKAFLAAAMDPSRQPVFVHCLQGSDRTGMMVAVYRVVVQGWAKPDAINEMVNGGFGFHEIYGDLTAYVNALDVDSFGNFSPTAKDNAMTTVPTGATSPLPTADQVLAKIPTKYQQIAAPLLPGVLALANLGLLDLETWTQAMITGNTKDAVAAAISAMNLFQFEQQMDATNAAFDVANSANADRIQNYKNAVSLLAGGIGSLLSTGLLMVGL